jgi:hypothetical protein
VAQEIIDAEHLKMLSIFHYIVAGLALIGLLFLCLHFLVMTAVFANPVIWNSHKNYPGPPPAAFTFFLTIFYLFIGGWLAASGALNLLSANFLRQRRHRTFSLVVAALNCLHIPFGTILGVFTMLVLSRPSVSAKYANERSAATPR